MGASLANEKGSVSALEKKSRDLQAKLDTLAIVEGDFAACIKLMEECEGEVRKAEEAQKRVARHREGIDKKTIDTRELEVREQQIKRQMTNAQEKLERVQQQAEKKRQDAQRKMQEIKESYGAMKSERLGRVQDIERKKAQIAMTEQKIADLRQTMEQELSGVAMEWSKLRNHVEVYMDEVAQGMNLEVRV